MASRGSYKLIDVFAGMGCASLGFRRAGFEIAAAVEIDPARCDVYESNLRVRPIRGDVLGVGGAQILRAAKARKNGRFCMVGCPPCQSFSKLSDTTRVDAGSDPRSAYAGRFAEIAEETRPAAIVFENVAWMANGPGKRFFRSYLRKIGALGYETVFRVVNAADYSVPQNRNRVIAISMKKRLMTGQARSSLEKFLGGKKLKRRTVRDAIGDLSPLGAGRADAGDRLHFSRSHGPKVLSMIRAVPKDGGSRSEMPREMWLECHKKISHGADSVYGRMRWDAPAPTMTCRCTTPACGRFIHPTQDRGISVREAMRIQTIPDSFKIGIESRRAAEEMIGDAVPVLLAERIGRKLLQVLP